MIKKTDGKAEGKVEQRKAIYYRLLKDTQAEVESKLKQTVAGTKEEKIYQECSKILTEVIESVLSNVKRQSLGVKIRTFWEHDLDYPTTAEVVGCSYETIRVIISRESKNAYAKYGVQLLDKIRNGKPLDAYIEYLVRTNGLSVEKIIPKEIQLELPQEKCSSTLNVEDCQAEIDFIRKINMANQIKELSGLNQEKLSHVLGVLQGQGNYSESLVSKKLWQYIYGNAEFKNLILELRKQRVIP